MCPEMGALAPATIPQEKTRDIMRAATENLLECHTMITTLEQILFVPDPGPQADGGPPGPPPNFEGLAMGVRSASKALAGRLEHILERL